MCTCHGSEKRPKSERSLSATVTLISPMVKSGWVSPSLDPSGALASDQPKRESGRFTAEGRRTRRRMRALAGASV
eukprot:scaffold1084_cov30-Tisochrysis_lutea.AAC.2